MLNRWTRMIFRAAALSFFCNHNWVYAADVELTSEFCALGELASDPSVMQIVPGARTITGTDTRSVFSVVDVKDAIGFEEPFPLMLPKLNAHSKYWETDSYSYTVVKAIGDEGDWMVVSAQPLIKGDNHMLSAVLYSEGDGVVAIKIRRVFEGEEYNQIMVSCGPQKLSASDF